VISWFDFKFVLYRYVAVAKSIGDKRAMVAEQAFGKPFAKVTVAKCGMLEDAPPPLPPVIEVTEVTEETESSA
jgi:hypothetical protein